MAFDFDPKFGLIMAGGSETKPGIRESHTDYVHISRDGGLTFEQLAALPTGPDYYADIFWIDEKTVFYLPQKDGFRKAFYLLDLETNTWKSGHKLKYGRNGEHVGIITLASGEKEIHFVGGWVKTEPLPADAQDCKSRCGKHYTKSVEIYNIATDTMREGMYRVVKKLLSGCVNLRIS